MTHLADDEAKELMRLCEQVENSRKPGAYDGYLRGQYVFERDAAAGAALPRLLKQLEELRAENMRLNENLEFCFSQSSKDEKLVQSVQKNDAALHAEIDRLRAEMEDEERSHVNTIEQRDAAEECANMLYAAVMGDPPEWSTHFSYRDAHEAVAGYVSTVEASLSAATARADECSRAAAHAISEASKAMDERDQALAREAKMRVALQRLYRAYVRLIEAGMDRITSLGGKCDPVDVMEASDPELQAARAALKEGQPQ
jgi:hypothetical protein